MNCFRVIKHRIRSAHSDHHLIANAMVLAALFVLFSSVARAVKEAAIAYRYGISAEVDAYLFVFNLVSWPVGVWFSVVTVILVPLVAHIQQGASTELPHFRSELFGLTLLLGLLSLLLSWFGIPLLLRSSWTGLPASTILMVQQITPMLTLLAPLGFVISLFSAWILAAGRHENTLIESVPSLTILMVLLVFPGGGLEPLVWGTIAGFVFQLASLAVPLASRGWIGAPYFSRLAPQWAPFWQGFVIMAVGQALMSLTGIIDQFFAAHLEIGAISELSYANRILSLIIGMGAIAVSRATLPVFSKAQARGEQQINRVAMTWVGIMFALGVAALIISWLMAPWVVELLFERGAFTSDNKHVVTKILRYGLIQLPFYFASLVIVSLIISRKKYYIISIIGGLNLIVKIIFNALMVPFFDVGGIMISTSIMLIFSCLFLSIAIFRKNF